MALPLRPLLPKDNRPTYEYAVTDIEAYKWIQFLCIGYYSQYDLDDGTRGEILEIFEDMHEFIEFVFSEGNPYDTIMAHFGGKYDFNFILKALFELGERRYHIHDIIPRGSGILCFKASEIEYSYNAYPEKEHDKLIIDSYKDEAGRRVYKYKKRTIVFRDSSAILPFSLASITENFDVETKKGTIDYETMDKVTPEVIDYLIDDLKGLYQSIRKYSDWPLIKNAGMATTMASQALRVFRTFMHKPIPSLTSKVDQFVRGAYFGGRTEIFKPFYSQKTDFDILKTYDVNSLYPYVMAEYEYPTKFAGWVDEYYPDSMGFYDVEVDVPESLYIPPLGTVYDPEKWNRFIFPTGKFRGKWSTVELNYAISLGVKITRVFKGAIFENGGFIFRSYIITFYEKRLQSKGNSVDNILSKLLMNSLYGRFGLALVREQLEIDNGEEGAVPHMDIPMDDEGYSFFRLIKKKTVLDSTFTNVAISAWVTSLARIHMHREYMRAPEKLYYTDTDSIFTSDSYDKNSKSLGEMKLEYKSKEACFLLPKTYIADTLSPIWNGYEEDNKTTFKTSKKIVMKGFDRKKISRFTVDDFYIALEGDMRRLRTTNPEKFATFKTAARHNKFLLLLKESPRQIRSRYDKREIIKLDNGLLDTRPLHIVNGEIINKPKIEKPI